MATAIAADEQEQLDIIRGTCADPRYASLGGFVLAGLSALEPEEIDAVSGSGDEAERNQFYTDTLGFWLGPAKPLPPQEEAEVRRFVMAMVDLFALDAGMQRRLKLAVRGPQHSPDPVKRVSSVAR